MNYKFSFFILFAGILFSACNKMKNKENTYSEYLYIDRFKEIEVNEIPLDFVDNKRYILLYSDDIDLQFKFISKITIKEDLIYIMDGISKKLLIYDKKTGKALNQVGERGNGPNEYIDISDFDIDENGNIYVIDGNLDRLFIYDNNLSLVKNEKLPFEADAVKVLNNGNFLFGLSSWNKGQNEGDMVILTNDKFQTLKTLITYDEFIDDSYWISEYYFTPINNYILYNRPPYNTVYKIDDQGNIVHSIHFDFGKEDVPNKEKKDIEKNLKNFENYNLLKGITIVEDDYIIGIFRKKGENRAFFIDALNNVLYLLPERRTSDQSDVLGYFEKTLISCIIPGSEKANSKELPKYIKEELDNGNFVLCLYQLK
ncbi:MAG: 6-bladed beta-propeller [Bacteroidales bacterium]|nr:6-bladed beta-propeller [Bacteroidales bacterium]